jgi:putative flippase GtrA
MKTLSKFLVFCIVGGFTFLIDISFMNLFFFMGLPFVFARTFSISISLIFNFFANRGLAFRATHKHPGRQLLPYLVVYLVSNLVNLGVSVLIVELAGADVININVASIIGTVVSIPISFFGSLLWTFKNK